MIYCKAHSKCLRFNPKNCKEKKEDLGPYGCLFTQKDRDLQDKINKDGSTLTIETLNSKIAKLEIQLADLYTVREKIK